MFLRHKNFLRHFLRVHYFWAVLYVDQQMQISDEKPLVMKFFSSRFWQQIADLKQLFGLENGNVHYYFEVEFNF